MTHDVAWCRRKKPVSRSRYESKRIIDHINNERWKKKHVRISPSQYDALIPLALVAWLPAARRPARATCTQSPSLYTCIASDLPLLSLSKYANRKCWQWRCFIYMTSVIWEICVDSEPISQYKAIAGNAIISNRDCRYQGSRKHVARVQSRCNKRKYHLAEYFSVLCLYVDLYEYSVNVSAQNYIFVYYYVLSAA